MHYSTIRQSLLLGLTQIYNEYINFDRVGPLQWGKDYQMCDSGKMQSPIDFNPREATIIKDKNASILFSDNFWTSNAEGELFNNGHTGR